MQVLSNIEGSVNRELSCIIDIQRKRQVSIALSQTPRSSQHFIVLISHQLHSFPLDLPLTFKDESFEHSGGKPGAQATSPSSVNLPWMARRSTQLHCQNERSPYGAVRHAHAGVTPREAILGSVWSAHDITEVDALTDKPNLPGVWQNMSLRNAISGN
jgi:hypothetical protein